jgi:hypothetical protein
MFGSRVFPPDAERRLKLVATREDNIMRDSRLYIDNSGFAVLATGILAFGLLKMLLDVVAVTLVIAAIIALICFTIWLLWKLFGSEESDTECSGRSEHPPRRRGLSYSARDSLPHKKSAQRHYSQKCTCRNKSRSNILNNRGGNTVDKPINAIVLPQDARVLIVGGKLQRLPPH